MMGLQRRRLMIMSGRATVTAPAAVTGLTATAISSTRIDLAWTDNATNETEYRVYRSTDNVTYALLATIAADSTSYSSTGLTASTLYYYKVAPYNAAGETLSDAASATTFFVGMLDTYTASIPHVYDISRCVLSAYTGNLVRLRRASDDAEADFTKVSASNPELNLAAIATWAGGAAYVVTVYDQKGGDDVTQATAGNQPAFTADGQNGHAVMTCDGNDHIEGAYINGGALSQPYTIIAMGALAAHVVNDDVVYVLVDGDDVAGLARIFKRNTETPDAWAIFAGHASVNGSTADASAHIFTGLFNDASCVLWVDGVSDAEGDAGDMNADGIVVGARYTLSGAWNGYIGMVAVFDPALSDENRQAVDAAFMTYWGL